MSLIIPKDYDPKLSIRDTEAAIRFIRETSRMNLVKSYTYNGCRRQCLLIRVPG